MSAIKDDHKVLYLAMSYDAIGNMTKRADNLDASRTESYGYDVISQLTSFTRGKTVNKTYQFDLLGNRVKTVENGVVTNYSTNNVNAYTAISGGMSFTPSYDGNGNMLNDDKHQYVYDYNSKMASVGDKSVSYKYDALGRRIAKNNNLFYYVGDQMVEDSTDGIVTSYLYGNNIDEALQMTIKGGAYYYHTNHLGSTMGLSDAKGNVVERVEYDVYGMPKFLDAEGNVLEASALGNNILFTGREYDAETGDYYFRARSMHPMVGRFMQKDPLMYVDGMNDLLYVNNLPVNYKDAFGTTKNTDCDNMPYISNPPYTGPYMYAAPPTFCEKHPELCDPSLNIGGEHCNVLGVGACFAGEGGIDKKGPNGNAELALAGGLYFSGSANINIGLRNSSKLDKSGTDEFRFDFGVGGWNFTRNRTNGDWEFTGSVGIGKIYSFNSTVTSKNGWIETSHSHQVGVGVNLGIIMIRHR